MTGEVSVDRECGPSSEPDDTYFIHRFCPLRDADHGVVAEYVYASRSNRELLSERHELRFANPSMVAVALRRAGFHEVSVVDSESISPFVRGTRPIVHTGDNR